MALWDGVVSQLRAYTPQELRELAAVVEPQGYDWQVGQVHVRRMPGRVTYLTGAPG